MLPVCSAMLLILVQLFAMSNSQEMETITGTIFCDNDFNFYVNGELVAQDPITTFPHNAVNVSFSIPRGKDTVFAIEAMDWADDVSGLEYDNRCVGDGGLRAMFSNGVVTNSSWICINHHYGPVNWKECVAGQTVRDQSLQLLPACKQNSTPPLVGCTSRFTARPEGWTAVRFDDSRWDYAMEFSDAEVGWGLLPAGCETGAIITRETDDNGDPITCPQNLDWGESKFIWRPDLDLENRILCRYSIKVEDSGTISLQYGIFVLLGAMLTLLSIV